MSRNRKERSSGGRRPPLVRAPRRGPRLSRGLAIAVLALALAAGVWLWQHRSRESARSGVPAPDSLDQLSPSQLFVRQRALFNDSRPTASLIYARHLSERLRTNWQAHLNYAIALNAAAMEGRPGGKSTLTRASVERVAMLRQAFEELDAADRSTSLARAHSAIELQRGDLYRIWGFATDAFAAYRDGVELDPSFPTAHERLKLWTRAVLDPGSWAEIR